MKVYRKKINSITLLEIMIVIFLIGLIGSVIGYNVKGSLESGKAFKSEHGAAQIRDILLLEASSGTDLNKLVSEPKKYLDRSGLCKDSSKMLKDGWGKEYVIKVVNDDISVTSDALESYNKKKGIIPKESEISENEET